MEAELIDNISAVLEKRADMQPELEALVDLHSGRRFTYAQLNARTNQTANLLAQAGVAPGDRVAVLMPNGHEFVETYFGIAKIGAVMVPLNWRLTPHELSYILRDSGARSLVFGTEFADAVAAIRDLPEAPVLDLLVAVGSAPLPPGARCYAELQAKQPTTFATAACPDGLLFIMYTSGTTGRPKGAVHTHATAFSGVLTCSATLQGRPGDRMLLPMPLFHVGGIGTLNFSFYQAKGVVLMRAFDPEATWRVVERERITNTMAVPAMLAAMLQATSLQDCDVSSLVDVSVGAAPVPLTLIEEYLARGIALQQVYGLTESAGAGVYLSSDYARRKTGSAGRAMFHTDLKVVDAAGVQVPPGEAGEILLRGPHLMTGYWNLPEATAEALRDGWLHTGDVGVLDEDGFVYVRDRMKDMIISGGENVYPAEIENVLLSHEGVADAAVIGRPDTRWGEVPVAVVVRRDPALEPASLVEFARERLARFKCPAEVHFVDALPRNPSGKVLKTDLRRQFVR